MTEPESIVSNQKRNRPNATVKVAPRRATRNASGFTVRHRDWWAMLMPILVTVGISMVANVAVGIWQGATFKSQVQHIDQHQTEQDKAINDNSSALRTLIERLPIDYVPRVEHEKDAVMEKEMRDMEHSELTNMQSKLDTILENTERRR